MAIVYCVLQSVIRCCLIWVYMVTNTMIHVLRKMLICLFKCLMVLNTKIDQLYPHHIPEGRRASIIGASVGDPYARVSQQHYE
jgi:hypothetical protein